MATATGTAPSSLTTPPADTSVPVPATTTTSTAEPASAAVATSSPITDASPSTTAPPMSASASEEAAAPAVKAADAATDTPAVASTGAGAPGGSDAGAAAAGASAQAAPSSSPSTSTPAPAAAATRTDAPAANAKQASSSRGSDEKGPSTSSRSTAKPANKKRRKRGGLAGLFVALGCMSSDEFDDDLPPAKVAPSGSNRNAAATTSAAATSTTTAAKDTKDASASSPATGVSAGKAAAVGAGAAAVAAGAGAAAATKSASTPAAAKTENNLSAGTSPVNGASGVDGANEAPATPTRGGDAVVIGGLAAGGEPTTPPLEETAGLTSGAVQAPGSGAEIIHQHMLHRTESDHHLAGAHGEVGKTESSAYTDEEGLDESGHQEMLYEDDFEDDEDRLIAQGGIGIPLDENGNPAPLLPELVGIDKDRKCLVLDLDETLLHSSFKMLPSADYIVPVEIESQTHNVYVIKRPGVDHFLTEMGKIYEIVVFTASLSKYADPVLDMLDVGRVVRHRLFRESCYNHKGNYVKDLSQLGRDIDKTIIIDNSPASYIFHPNNAVPVSTWFNDPHDTELTDLCPFLADLAGVDDVRGVLDGSI